MRYNDEMSKIALVGPGGRDKLKKLIQSLQDTAKEGENVEYVIAQALNDLNERVEGLEVSGGAKPSHTLTILQASSDDVDLSTALSWLKIDGRTPATIEDLFVFDTNSIIDAEEMGYGTFLPSYISKVNDGDYMNFSILFGFASNNFGKYGRVDISSSGDYNSVLVVEV